MWTRCTPDGKSRTTPAELSYLLILLILIPPLIALGWGGPYTDAAYAQFLPAREFSVYAHSLTAPLYTLMLALALHTGAPIAVAIGLGVLGWMIAIGAWWRAGRALGHPTLGIAAAFLLALHPLQGQTLGLETGLVLGLLSLASLWAVQGRFAPLLITTAILPAISPAATLLLLPPWLWWGLRRCSRLTLGKFAISMMAGTVPFGIWGWVSWQWTYPEYLALGIAAGEVLFAAAIAHGVAFRGKTASLYRGLSFLALAALLIAQVGMLWQDVRLRPIDRMTTYRNASRLVQEQVLPDETVLTAYAGLVGYLSGRWTLSMPADASDADILSSLMRNTPDYCLAPNTLSWQLAMFHPWFMEHYVLIQMVANPRDPASPLRLFRYHPSPFDFGEIVPTALIFALDGRERLELTAYQLDHRRLTPGQSRHLTLYWRTDTGLGQPLQAVLRLTERATGKTWLRIENDTPGNLRTDFWAPGQIVADRYALTPPDNLPPGDYELTLALFLPNGREVLPVERDKDTPFPLTHLYRPPVISTTPPMPDSPALFRLGDEIELIGYDAPERVAPGETFLVALYWHALRPIDTDYKVFVHLRMADGILLTQSDSIPVNWTYPTSRWQAGEYIIDEHWLTLDASIPRGDAWLFVGMYDPLTGERLSGFADTGEEFPEGQIPLQQVRVR